MNSNTVVSNRNARYLELAFGAFDLKKADLEWSFEIIKLNSFIAFGVGDKKMFKTKKTLKIFNSINEEEINLNKLEHNIFIITSNGFIFNSNNQEQSSHKPLYFNLSDGDKVYFKYIKESSQLHYKFKNHFGILNNVDSTKYDLSPLILLKDKHDEVLFEIIRSKNN